MDIRYWKPSDDASWHIIASTGVSGNDYSVSTLCGIERTWDQTFVDRLPGGGEESCENCLMKLAGDVDEPPKKKKSNG